jgi:hypothetical protein
MLRVIKGCLKYVAGKIRTETAVLYALLSGALGNRTFTPEHVTLAQLTSWAIGFFPPCTSPAESATSPNEVSIHLEILYCFCIPLQQPNGSELSGAGYDYQLILPPRPASASAIC